jgi:5-keto 4-deoxyuronate isomerase
VLVGGEGTSLLQKLVHKRGLAVVNVGDNGDITKGA